MFAERDLCYGRGTFPLLEAEQRPNGGLGLQPRCPATPEQLSGCLSPVVGTGPAAPALLRSACSRGGQTDGSTVWKGQMGNCLRGKRVRGTFWSREE